MLLEKILADGVVDKAELDALFERYDRDGSGKLERDEMYELAKHLTRMMPGTEITDVLAVMDFYQVDFDGELNREELKTFLEVHVAD